MEEKQPDKISKGVRHTDPGINRNMNGEVLYIIAWVTLGQGLCFLGAAMFLNDVSVLPNDPFTLIGTMYAAMGIAFLSISKFCGGRSSEYTSSQKCAYGTWNNQTENTCNRNEILDEQNKFNEQCNAKANDNQKTTETVPHNEEQEHEKDATDRKLKESREQQWDMVEAVGDVRVNGSHDQKNVTKGCDSAVILTSK